MPTKIIQIIVEGIQKSLTLSGTTIRTATLSGTTRTSVTDALLEADRLEVFTGALSSRVQRKVTTEEVSNFIKNNPGEAALVFASITSTAADLYDFITDLATTVKDAIFDAANDDGSSIFASIERQDGTDIMAELGYPFGVEPSVVLINDAYANQDDLTELPCRCAARSFDVNDRKIDLDGIIEIVKSVPQAGCQLNANLTTCEKVSAKVASVESTMDTCNAYEALVRITGSVSDAADLIVAVKRIIRGEK